MPRLVKTLTGELPVVSLALGADGDRLLAGLDGDDGSPDLWSVAAGKVLTKLSGLNEAATCVALDPDIRQAAASAAAAPVVLWDLMAGGPPKRAPKPAAVSDQSSRLAFSPDGRLILSSFFGSLTQFDTSLTARAQLRIHDDVGRTSCFALAPGGAQLAVGYVRFDRKTDLKVFDLLSSQVAASAASHPGSGVICLVWSQPGVLSGGGDGKLALTGPDGALLRAFVGHRGAVQSVGFIGGRMAVSGGADQTVKLWSLASGVNLASLDHAAAVSSVAASADGGTVVSAGGPSIKVWDISDVTP